MIKLTVKLPFKYQGKQRQPGESMFFDYTNPEQLKQAQTLMSPINPYSSYVYIDTDSQILLNQSLAVNGLLEAETPVYAPDTLTDPLTDETSFNVFEQQARVVHSKTSDKKEDKPKLESVKTTEKPLIAPESVVIDSLKKVEERTESKEGVISSDEKVIEGEKPYDLLEEVKTRKNELSATHYPKLKQLAQEYNLNSTVKKDEIITSILRHEFKETAEQLNQTETLEEAVR